MKYFVYSNILSYFCGDFPIKLKLMRFGLIIFSVLLIGLGSYLSACNTENSANDNVSLSAFNLEKYGIPTVVQIPEGATITEDPQSREKALMISLPPFNMRVDMYPLDSGETAGSWLRNRLEEEKLEGDFAKIMAEDSLGFVVERKDADIGTSYHFQYIVQKNNDLIIFSEGIPQKKNFDLQTIMQMYNAVKQ